MKTAELIDAARRISHVESDYRLAANLGVSRQLVSQWRAGTKWPDLYATYRLADMAEREPQDVIAALQIERARLDGNVPLANAWLEYVEKYCTTAAAVLLSALLTATPDAGAMPSQAAQAPANAQAEGGLYIMSNGVDG